jgi:GH15 family glucan-1,4-alpha-glucosidase
LHRKLHEDYFDPDDLLYKDIQLFFDEDNNLFTKELVEHKGYITLFPIFFGLIQVEDQHVLRAYHDLMKKELWSDFGLLSLSKFDS